MYKSDIEADIFFRISIIHNNENSFRRICTIKRCLFSRFSSIKHAPVVIDSFQFFWSYYTQQTENKCLKNVFIPFTRCFLYAFAINLFFEEEQLFLFILFLSKQLVFSKCEVCFS